MAEGGVQRHIHSSHHESHVDGKQREEKARLLENSEHHFVAAMFPAEELLKEVNHLVQSHQAELHRVLGGWLRQQKFLGQQQEQCATTNTPDSRELFNVDIADITLGLEQSCSPEAKWGTIPESLIRRVESVAGKQKKHKHQRKSSGSKSLFADRREEAVESQTTLQRFTTSRQYEWFSGMLIFCNAAYIGFECEFLANRASDFADDNLPQPMPGPVPFLALQACFSFLFALELGLRWVAEGLCKFFFMQDCWWNLLDICVVGFSVVDTVTELVSLRQQERGGTGLGTFTALRVLRIVRLVRVVKIIRVMRFFRELRMMVYSIFGSMKSLLWVILVLSLTFYMFGIALTSGTTTYLETPEQWLDKDNEDVEDVRKYFGSLGSSMLSLFMAMSGGNDWGQYYEALGRLPWQYRALFLCFITFSVFAVVNIVTGVFVDNAMQSSHTDREIVVHEEMEEKKAFLQILRDIFMEMDKDGEGSISINTFERSMNDERVIAYFNSLKLDVSDARTLFRLLDVDSSDEVSITEFLTGCFRLQGEARSLDTKIMRWQIDSLQEKMQINDKKLQSTMYLMMLQLQGGAKNIAGELQPCIHSSMPQSRRLEKE